MSAKIRSEKMVRIREWMKLVSVTGGVQIAVQVFSFISGILVIRLLPTNEYAFYTVANTMLGTINLLSDSGVTSGVMSQGGKVWQSRADLGKVLMTGLGMRRKFAAFSLMFGIPILFMMLHKLGASWFVTCMIIVSLIPAFYATLIDSILEIVPKLHQTIIPLQKNQLMVSAGRLALTGLTLFFFPLTGVALIAAGVPRIFGNIRLKKIAALNADVHQQPDKQISEQIMNVVKRVLPGTIYFCVSGQVTVWLISVFGQTSDVAELGALGRITILLNVISSILVTLIIPRFARLQDTSKMRSYFWKFQGVVVAVGIFLVILVKFTAIHILKILGPKYYGLDYALTLSMLSGCLQLIGAFSLALYTSRGWVINPAISITLSIVTLVVGIIVFNIGTLIGVIKLDILVNINQIFIHSGYCLYRIYKLK